LDAAICSGPAMQTAVDRAGVFPTSLSGRSGSQDNGEEIGLRVIGEATSVGETARQPKE